MPVLYSARHERMKYGDIKLYTGTSCPELAGRIATHMGLELCDREIVQLLARRMGAGDEFERTPEEWKRILLRRTAEKGVGLEELTDDELAGISEVLTPDVREVLTVTGSVAARDARGGTAPVQVANQRAVIRDTIDTLRMRLR